jgi:hypothetical protein
MVVPENTGCCMLEFWLSIANKSGATLPQCSRAHPLPRWRPYSQGPRTLPYRDPEHSECNRAAEIYLLEKAQKGLTVKVYLATAIGANMWHHKCLRGCEAPFLFTNFQGANLSHHIFTICFDAMSHDHTSSSRKYVDVKYHSQCQFQDVNICSTKTFTSCQVFDQSFYNFYQLPRVLS